MLSVPVTKERIPVSNPLTSISSFIHHCPPLTLSTQALALGNLVHEVGLLLLQVGGEALLLGALHSLLDGITLGSTVGRLLFLDSLGELAVVPLQGLAEFGVGLSLVIKVHGVGYAWRKRRVSYEYTQKWQAERKEAKMMVPTWLPS